MDDAIADRPTKDKMKKKIKKETKKAKHKAYKKIDALNEHIKEVENYMHEKFKEVEKVHKEFEANINWKVDECTGLLKVRVTEQFVWDAIRTIEERTRKDIKSITENELQKFDKILK
jgi:predicted RNase H-like nuclease (RuvC/YqgF family)